MLKVPLTFLVHRLMLLVVALAAVNFTGVKGYMGDDALPIIRPLGEVWSGFKKKLETIPETATVKRLLPLSSAAVVKSEPRAFFWAARWLCAVLRFSPLAAVLLLSNLFLILLLAETFQLLNRMVSESMAARVCILLIFWPASYEMSLGSAFAFTAYCFVKTLRASLDDTWASAGVSLGFLMLAEPTGILLLPLVIYLFLYFCQGKPNRLRLKSAALFLIAPVLVLLWKRPDFVALGRTLEGSALFNLASGMKVQGGKWQGQLGQLLTLLLFGLGMIVGLIQNSIWVHRMVLVATFFLWLLFATNATLASKAPLAGLCLAGLVGSPGRLLVQYALWSLSLHEVFAAFS